MIKIHQVLKFDQSRWMTPYVELNSQRRAQASNKFEENFYKLMVNSVYGKTCEGLRNRMSVFVVRDEDDLLEKTLKHNFISFKTIESNVALVTTRNTTIHWTKPRIFGVSILDLSKMYMFRFHYLLMKQHFNCTLLYSDTDSLTYKISTEDLYKNLEENLELVDEFDFSNYSESSKLCSTENQKKVLKFKDELHGLPMVGFVGLKAKMYSILSLGKYIKPFFQKSGHKIPQG